MEKKTLEDRKVEALEAIAENLKTIVGILSLLNRDGIRVKNMPPTF